MSLNNVEMASPLISILVPSYRHQDFLKKRISSIFSQSYVNFEVIVIDDGSTDGSHEMITELKQQYNFRYIRNIRNSGTPFSSWEKICDIALGEYIWICESDDFAASNFLQSVVERLIFNPQAVLAYSHSFVIDEHDEIIGDTQSYFKDFWQSNLWEADFSEQGPLMLQRYQLLGQIVPNMSSAVIRIDAFRKSISSQLKKFKLTGDWMFIGNVLQFGDVEFLSEKLNYFRKHEDTSRQTVSSARSQAEFILTKYFLSKTSNQTGSMFANLMSNDALRFLYQPANFLQLTNELLKISPVSTIGCAFKLAKSLLYAPHLLQKFAERKSHAKAWLSKQGKQ